MPAYKTRDPSHLIGDNKFRKTKILIFLKKSIVKR